MSRIIINIPDTFIFSTKIPIRVSDINRHEHVGWDSFFRIISEANVQFWNSLDYSEPKGGKTSRIMVEAGINYKKQAYYGQTLIVEIAVAEVTERGFSLVYKVTNMDDGIEIARAKTGFLCFDYHGQKVIPIPEELRNKLKIVN